MKPTTGIAGCCAHAASGHVAAAAPSVAKKSRRPISLPCDPPAVGHSCPGGMIPRFHRAVSDSHPPNFFQARLGFRPASGQGAAVAASAVTGQSVHLLDRCVGRPPLTIQQLIWT